MDDSKDQLTTKVSYSLPYQRVKIQWDIYITCISNFLFRFGGLPNCERKPLADSIEYKLNVQNFSLRPCFHMYMYVFVIILHQVSLCMGLVTINPKHLHATEDILRLKFFSSLMFVSTGSPRIQSDETLLSVSFSNWT